MVAGIEATWVWWGTAIVVVVAVVRHVVASRRLGRRPAPSGFVIAIAVPIIVAVAVALRLHAAWIFAVFVLVPVALLAWVKLREDRTQIDLGPIVFSDEFRAEVRDVYPRQMFGMFYPVSGPVRLLVGQDMIATRVLTGNEPRWLATAGLLDYTFRAADCEVERPRVGETSFFVSLGKPSIVLRGADRRGRQVELALAKPRTATLDDVYRELLRAGARRPADELAPVPQPS